MPEEIKKNPSINGKKSEEQDVEKMRNSVLKWIEEKPRPPRAEAAGDAGRTNAVNLKPKSDHKSFWLGLALIAIGIIVLFGLLLYQFKWNNRVILAITTTIPYPIGLVDYQPILYSDWQQQISTLNNFYLREQEVDPLVVVPTDYDTQRHIFERMVEQKILKSAGAKYQISVSKKDLDDQTQLLADEIGDLNALEVQLKDLYDWSVNDFQKNILEPLLLKSKLTEVINSQQSGSPVDIEKYLENLKQEAKIWAFINL